MSEDVKKTRYLSFHFVYLTLFALSGILILFDLVASAHSYMSEGEPDAQWTYYLYIIVLLFYIAAAGIHQIHVYSELYEIEEHEKYWKDNTNGFVSTYWERLLRGLIFVFMLLAFSKAVVVFDALQFMSVITTGIAPVSDALNNLSLIGEESNKTKVYLVFICISTFGLCMWDLGAIIFAPRSKDNKSKEPNCLSKRDFLPWLLTDFVALIVWFTITIYVFTEGNTELMVILLLLVLVYLFLVTKRFVVAKNTYIKSFLDNRF